MTLLTDFAVVQIGDGSAAAVCGRLMADVGARVTCVGSSTGTPLASHLDHSKRLAQSQGEIHDALAEARVILIEGSPRALAAGRYSPAAIRQINASAVLVMISPYGQSGPRADDPATDLTLCFASGISRLLTGQVDDLAEAPIAPTGGQSAFIGGVAAACAGMHAAMNAEKGNTPGADIDVSIQEALATLAITELTRAGVHGRSWSRKRLTDGNGATVTILPASDGYAAISPREEKQWASWLKAMGSPAWGNDPRFVKKADRVANWDALHALMSAWSRQHGKQWIADTAQAAHVPSFPLREVAEHLDAPQLKHRGYFRPLAMGGTTVRAPGNPFGLQLTSREKNASPTPSPSAMPLAGVRVLDFSWVIAGPTTTRYLAAMGAEVIKVEAPGPGDPGRASDLHTVLGQAKKAIVLDLKKPEGVELARALAARCDILLENYATGVMDRLGLGAEALKAANPDLIYISASGMARSGPDARAVAYGTLLQCYAGFAGLNRHPDVPPRIGFAWLDPMCGLMLAFIAAAALWQRQHGGAVARVDFSMVEAMLWTMAEPLLTSQLGAPARPVGNTSPHHAPHGVWRCTGDDDWVCIVVRTDGEWRSLCSVVPGLADRAGANLDQRRAAGDAISAILATWLAPQAATAAADVLLRAGIPAAALARSSDLVASEHLKARAFWDQHTQGVMPGLPWRANFGRVLGAAPGLGADTESVLTGVLGLAPEKVAALRAGGVLGRVE